MRLTLWAGFFIYAVAVWFLAKLLEPEGGAGLWILRIALWLLGLAAVGLILWSRSKKEESAEEPDSGGEAIDAAVAAAEARLASSRQANVDSLSKLPVVMVLGPEASAKTTMVVRSGLDPDLLAGEVFRGKLVAPTDAVNVWYTHGTAFVEAGGPVLEQRSRWARVLRHVQPLRLAPVLFGQPQAPRVALVCFSCEDLLKPGAAEEVPAAARELRKRLAEMSSSLGIRLPVYVLFTKADRIPHFTDYVRNLTHEETREVLGTTLRLPADDAPGNYADREYRRVSESMRRLTRALAERRLSVLGRDGTQEGRCGAYEFPREFKRIGELVSRFLVELCKPSQLAVSPFLRGFYFSGIRPVIVTDPSPEGGTQEELRTTGGIVATQVFGSGSQAPPTPTNPSARKVPQWVFLHRVFRDVILRDRIAMGITQHGTRVEAWRRAALAAVSGIFFFLIIALFVSYAGNRSLQARALQAARGLRGALPTEPALPDERTLEDLEELRAELAKLGEYRREGRPLRLNWGLYRGDDAYEQARRIYLSRLETLVLDPARERMVADLRELPAGPGEGSEFQAPYDLLKTYLMTTTHTEKIDSVFLMERLPEYWRDGRPLDEERAELAARQFAYYAGPLCAGATGEEEHPCGARAEPPTVERAQRYLSRFNAQDRVYSQILSDAASLGSVQFNRDFPGSSALLVNDYEVPGAFTAPGWSAISERLANEGQGIPVEDWVLGQYAPSVEDRVRLSHELRARYREEYVRHWTAFLRSASIPNFTGLRDASRKLEALSANQSPLLLMLHLAARHTAVDTTSVGRDFQPVHVLVDPSASERYTNEVNQPYMDALIELQVAVDAAARESGEAQNEAKRDASDEANDGVAVVAQIAQRFNVDGMAGQVGSTLRDLLVAPVEKTRPHLQVVSLAAQRRAQINRAGAGFCSSLAPLLRKYPFASRSTVEASIDEVVAMFEPGNGALRRFYDRWLSDLLVLQGSQYSVNAGADLTPSQSFVGFLNKAQQVSTALWPQNESEPRLDLVLKLSTSAAIPTVSFNVDGRPGTWTRTSTAQQSFVWFGRDAREVRVSGQISGREELLLRFEGTWALFKLFHAADWTRVGQAYNVRWNIPEHNVVLDGQLNLLGRPPILQPGFFDDMRCVSRVIP